MTDKKIENVTPHEAADGIMPGIHGQRSFPQKSVQYPDPFLLLDHIGPQVVYPDFFVDGHPHPHRGFETITMMFKGYLDHVDSIGTKVKLESGGIQLMNAGSGVIHGGKMGVDPSSGEFNEVQLWINVPKKRKMNVPFVKNFSHEEIPAIDGDGSFVRLFSGEYQGRKGPAYTQANTMILHAGVSRKKEVAIEAIPSNYHTMVYVLSGSLTDESGTQIESYQLLTYSSAGNQIRLRGSEDSEILVLAGEPLNEPMVMGGPFVMSDSNEIETAFADFRAGKFGEVN